jgi:capsular exopolysaccharide synthesis family protein
VKVNFDSPDAAFSAQVVNALGEAFIAANLERRFDASSYAKTYLEERLQQMRQRLEDAESQLVQFARAEGIVNIDDRESLTGRNLSELNIALSRAQDDRVRTEAKWRQAEATPGAALPDVLDSKLIQDLQAKRAEAAAQYQDQLRIFKPGYPLLNQLNGQVAELDRQIGVEVANIKSSIAAEYHAAADRERLLRGELNAARTEALDLQQRSVKYNILKREVDTSRELYEGLLQRYREIGIAGGVGTNNISIVDRGELPGSPFKPNLLLNLALGLLLGAFGGVLLAFVLDYLDDSVKAPDDVEHGLGLAVLGVIPKLADGTPAQALADPRSPFAEAYRSLRTSLQFSTDEGVPRTLLVTSSSPTEGKSTTALALARNFAQLGQRVLLIDTDLRNPSLHRVLGEPNAVGLSNHLAGSAVAREVVRPLADLPTLHIVTSGPLPPNPAELLAGPKLLAFLAMAGERYDQIILDGPPVMGLADAPIVASIASGTLLVIEAGSTRVGQVRAAARRLLAARARLVGTLLTKFDPRKAGYNYGYGGHAYYAYGAKAALEDKT